MLHQNREHPAAPSRSPGGERPALNQTDYDRAMGRLRVCMRVLSAVLLALIARSVIDGANLAVVLAAALIALLLLASGVLWLYGRRLEPHASASRTATPKTDMRSGSPSPIGTNRAERHRYYDPSRDRDIA
jgi:hypothetical protein